MITEKQKDLKIDDISESDSNNSKMMLADLKIESLVKEYKEKNEEKKEIETDLAELKQVICLLMRENESLVNEDGEIIVTWSFSKPVKRFNLKLFKEDMPFIYEQYELEGDPVRTFLVK